MIKSGLIFFLLLIYINPILAEEIQITSDKLTVDRKVNQSTFTGNVYAENKTFKIWSDKLIIEFNEDDEEIEIIKSYNKVKINYENMSTLSDEAIYEPNTRILKLKGNVIAIENDNEITCDELILDIHNSTSIMKSNTLKKVKATIVTKK